LHVPAAAAEHFVFHESFYEQVQNWSKPLFTHLWELVLRQVWLQVWDSPCYFSSDLCECSGSEVVTEHNAACLFVFAGFEW